MFIIFCEEEFYSDKKILQKNSNKETTKDKETKKIITKERQRKMNNRVTKETNYWKVNIEKIDILLLVFSFQ